VRVLAVVIVFQLPHVRSVCNLSVQSGGISRREYSSRVFSRFTPARHHDAVIANARFLWRTCSHHEPRYQPRHAPDPGNRARCICQQCVRCNHLSRVRNERQESGLYLVSVSAINSQFFVSSNTRTVVVLGPGLGGHITPVIIMVFVSRCHI
jgi:hypothetical protein